jgi:hypothetical protein
MKPSVIAAVVAAMTLQLTVTLATLNYVVSIEHRLTKLETQTERK